MSARLNAALAQIDITNQQDPNLYRGEPLAFVQGRCASTWLPKLRPTAGEELQLAARSHHLKRWELKRSDFPAGRTGYLNWRRSNKKLQASEATKIMEAAGFGETSRQRVSELLLRRNLGTDAETQTLEDVACLTFLETEFEEVAGRLTKDKMISVLAKTLKKMSSQAIEAAVDIPMSDHCRHILATAVAQGND